MAKAKTKAPEQTFAEDRYLRELKESKTKISVRLHTGDTVSGVVEFFDATFFRLTREGEPNIFLYKEEILYFWEEAETE